MKFNSKDLVLLTGGIAAGALLSHVFKEEIFGVGIVVTVTLTPPYETPVDKEFKVGVVVSAFEDGLPLNTRVKIFLASSNPDTTISPDGVTVDTNNTTLPRPFFKVTIKTSPQGNVPDRVFFAAHGLLVPPSGAGIKPVASLEFPVEVLPALPALKSS